MGKSKKKSTPKVDSAPMAVVSSENKGKRNGEDDIAKAVSAKKQKIERDETVVAKDKAEENKPKKVESNCESKDDSCSEDEPKAAVEQTKPLKEAPVVVKETKKDNSSDASDVSDDEPKKQPDVALENGSKKDSSSDDISDETKVATKPAAEVEQEDSSGDEESSEEDEEPPKANQATPVVANKKNSSTDNSSDEESGDEEESRDEKPPKTPKKDTDVEMVDAQETKKSALKTPETPAIQQNQNTGSKTLFAGNLSFDVQESDVKEFFKDAGEIAEIRFASDASGRFKGFGHIEFATAEGAQKALDLNGQNLLNRPVKLDLARERGANTPNTRERGQNLTIFVKGFDTSADEDDMRNSLKQHFASCGEMTRMSIPPDRDNDCLKGTAHIDFVDSDGFNKALELDGSDLGGFYLSVQKGKPRESGGSGGGGRFGDRRGGGGGGGRFGDRRGGGGGRFGDRRGGGRFGRGGGGRSGRGRGGRGTW